MPELPDVRVFKMYLDATSLHQRIERVEIFEKGVIGDVGPGPLRKRLARRELLSSRAPGKLLFVEIDGPVWLQLHFGMTGFLKDFAKEEKEPAHARVLFRFRNGYALAYDSRRKLGEEIVKKTGSRRSFCFCNRHQRAAGAHTAGGGCGPEMARASGAPSPRNPNREAKFLDGCVKGGFMSLPENVKDHLESNGVAYKHYSHDEEFLASRGADLVRLRREGLCQDRHGASG